MKLSVQDLGMFISAECEITIANVPTDIVRHFARVGEKVVIEPILLAGISQGIFEVKPILRLLSDITDEEVMEFFEMSEYFVKGTSEEYKRNRIYLINRDQQFSYRPVIFKWLLERHFDIFGWIEKGLAIDKTKLQPQQTKD